MNCTKVELWLGVILTLAGIAFLAGAIQIGFALWDYDAYALLALEPIPLDELRSTFLMCIVIAVLVVVSGSIISEGENISATIFLLAIPVHIVCLPFVFCAMWYKKNKDQKTKIINERLNYIDECRGDHERK